MPNHIVNLVKSNINLSHYLTEYTDEKTGEIKKFFDFNKIVQMPEGLQKSTSNGDIMKLERACDPDNRYADPMAAHLVRTIKECDDESFKQLIKDVKLIYEGKCPEVFGFELTCLQGSLTDQRVDKERLENIILCLTNIKETGYVTWYDWACQHWGTKWNTYDNIQLSDNCILFQTAWCSPSEIFKTLSQLNNNSEITVIYNDEGSDDVIKSVYNGDSQIDNVIGTMNLNSEEEEIDDWTYTLKTTDKEFTGNSREKVLEQLAHAYFG